MVNSFQRAWLAAVLLACTALQAQASELNISAASSLSNAFRELGGLFESHHPEVKVAFNVAASDALVAQIGQGAPVDACALADQQAMDRAQSQGWIVKGTRRNFAANALVMIVPVGQNIELKKPGDLAQTQVTRVAMGNPQGVPAGRYAKSALESAGLWPMVAKKAIFATNVRQALDYVARGEVDAGFVYATDAALMKHKVKVVATLPTPVPITYPMAMVSKNGHEQAARQFLDFVESAEAQAVLARYGFKRP